MAFFRNLFLLREKISYDMCNQGRLKVACDSVQFDHSNAILLTLFLADLKLRGACGSVA